MRILILFILLLPLWMCSCSDDDGNLRTVNIKLEVITSNNPEAKITTTLNNDLRTEEVEALPYSYTYAQQEVETGTFVKLTYLDISDVIAGPGGQTSWVDYDATLNISVDNAVVSTKTLVVTEGSGVLEIDYTFD